MKAFFKYLLTFLGLTVSFSGGKLMAHELDGERIHSLDSQFEVRRDGKVDVDLRFSVSVEGNKIKRGPCLHFITVFEGPAGLVLDNGLEFTGVFRDGQKEPFSQESGGGQRSLYLGSKDVFLESGTYEYQISYTSAGEWLYRGGEAVGVFDVSGPFRGFMVESAKATVRLPDGSKLVQYIPAVQGGLHEGPAYDVDRQEGNQLIVSTTGPLGHNHAFFINAVWSTQGFVSRNHCLQVMQQHPRIPLAGFSALLLIVALFVLLTRGFRRSPQPRVATA